uniref:Uncharacterized protein n=1 Tax=Vespula pensylvanica TaxID=30213 RepID=A0A834KRG8_VESPE|nr:hypothetical protein H0235_013274 [Vespula pensylvanica]
MASVTGGGDLLLASMLIEKQQPTPRDVDNDDDDNDGYDDDDDDDDDRETGGFAGSQARLARPMSNKVLRDVFCSHHRGIKARFALPYDELTPPPIPSSSLPTGPFLNPFSNVPTRWHEYSERSQRSI